MVRIQQPFARPDTLLIGSDLPDARAAHRELEAWSARNGYRLSPCAPPLAVFEGGTLVREWVLVELLPRRKPLPGLGFLTRNRRRASLAAERAAA